MKCENKSKKKGKRVLSVFGERNLAKKNDQKQQKSEVEPSPNQREREELRNF